MARVDILLATYNGAAYLREQLASLTAQTHRNWRLIARDDGSEDTTLEILRDWADSVENDVVILQDDDKRLGPAQSFGRLLTRSDAAYFAFCDQDDVWLDTKIERLLTEIQPLETDTPKPLLVHSDLAIVDADLAPNGKRLWGELQISNPNADTENAEARASLLMQNTVTGCALLGNAELRRRAAPLPASLHVHDSWVALVAAFFGTVKGIPEPLVSYRQHGSNTIGASGWDPVSILKRITSAPGSSLSKAVALSQKIQQQAASFHDRHGANLSDADRRMVEDLATLASQSLLQRKTFMSRHSAYPQARLRRLLFLATL